LAMATLAASSSVSDDTDSDSSQLVSLPSPSLPQTLPIPRNPKFNLLHGRRSIWFPSLLLRGARDRISASRALDAVTVVGIDFALPLLQVQRGKHMGFSRYPPTSSFCLLLPPHLHFSLLPSQHMPAVCISHSIRRSSARPAFPIYASMDSWTLRSRNQTAKADFLFCSFFSDATVDLSRICFSATYGVGFGRYNRLLSSPVQN